MDHGKTDQELARDLANYLTTKSGYNSLPPLEQMVRDRISTMARSIADSVVETAGGLQELIRRESEKAIMTALADDKFLKGIVAKSVAEALVTRYRESEDE